MQLEEARANEGGHRYHQVYAHLAARIGRGEWRAHDKLPSVRLLAGEYGVHRLTAFRACRMLIQHGHAYAKEKSGYYVSPAAVSPMAAHAEDGAGNRGGPVIESLRNDMADIQQRHADYVFSQALIDPNLLPNLFLSDYVKRVFDTYPKLIGTYASVQGDEELREVLCRYLEARHRLQIAPEEMLITTGATQAIDLIARMMLRPMDTILVERPTYSAALDIFRSFGARTVPVDIRPGGYDLEAVEREMRRHKPRFFYLNPTFHNPTGYTVPAGVRKQLVELAERYRCLLVEDDAFHDMYFDQAPPAPLFAYDTSGWVVYLRSFSKYVAPGLRISAVVGRRAVMEPLVTVKSLADNGTPLVNQKLFLHYFQSERMRTHQEKLRIALQVRRDLVEAELAGAGWRWVSPAGGLNLWLQLPEGISVDRLFEESLRHSIAFVPGRLFDPLREMRSYLRLSYSFASEGLLREGVRRLVGIAQGLTGS